ncbi:MAG: FecR domain-containing protein [Desulfovibrionaceae bacterium]
MRYVLWLRMLVAVLLVCWSVAPRLAVAAGDAASSQAPVASVTRIQGAVRASLDGAVRTLAMGDALRLGETVLTGPQARLEVVFPDGSALTLGEETEFVVDAYLYDPDAGRGGALFALATGAFRVVTGRMTAMRGASLEVRTPRASIGIRGTDFWGGYLSPDVLEVLLLSGDWLEVRNRVGVTILDEPGEGVSVPSPDQAPGPVMHWPEAKMRRAVDTVAFR